MRAVAADLERLGGRPGSLICSTPAIAYRPSPATSEYRFARPDQELHYQPHLRIAQGWQNACSSSVAQSLQARAIYDLRRAKR